MPPNIEGGLKFDFEQFEKIPPVALTYPEEEGDRSLPEHLNTINPLEAHVGLLDPLDTYPNLTFLQDLRRINIGICREFNTHPQILEPLVVLKHSKEEVAEKHHGPYMKVLAEILLKEGVVGAFPPYGATSILHQMLFQDISPDKLIPAWIRGTKGIVTGEAEVEDLNPVLIDPDNRIVVGEDVTDSWITILLLALARYKYREKLEGGYDAEVFARFSELIRSLQQAHKEDRDRFYTPDKCQQAAELLHVTNVVVAPIYNKRQEVMDAIEERAQQYAIDGDWWGVTQAKTAEVVVPIDRGDWIMGGVGEWRDGQKYPSLDAGVNGENRKELGEPEEGMLFYIPVEHHKKLREWGFDRVYLRVLAGAEGLAVLTGSYTDLVREVAGLITEYMDRFYPQTEYQETE